MRDVVPPLEVLDPHSRRRSFSTTAVAAATMVSRSGSDRRQAIVVAFWGDFLNWRLSRAVEAVESVAVRAVWRGSVRGGEAV